MGEDLASFLFIPTSRVDSEDCWGEINPVFLRAGFFKLSFVF